METGWHRQSALDIFCTIQYPFKDYREVFCISFKKYRQLGYARGAPDIKSGPVSGRTFDGIPPDKNLGK